MDKSFELISEYEPTGDQPAAIDALVRGIDAGERAQTLLGVTGSGKTFTMANIIARCGRPALVLAHIKLSPPSFAPSFARFSQTTR